jgi:hypothetical protein
MSDITVRCNSCSAKNEVYVNEVPETYEQYSQPHIDIPSAFSCCECGRKHLAGVSVELVESNE